MNKPKSLLDLYKLLWEQIKVESVIGLLGVTQTMYGKDIITHKEMLIIDDNILLEKEKIGGFVNSKTFVQRMIKELENQN